MTTVVKAGQDGTEALAHDGEQPVLAEGECSLPERTDRPSYATGAWLVDVQVREHLITRSVYYRGKPWSPADESAYADGQHPSEVIWSTWPATLAEEIAAADSPLEELQHRWDATISRLRDSAKWMAAVLGAALASVIPAAPFAHLGQRHVTAVAVALGITGLLLVSVTLLLVLQVMRPQSVSYADVQEAKPPTGLDGKLHNLIRKRRRHGHSHALESPLYRWQHTILAHPDLYLPCGVYSLVALRQLMTVEQLTLVALSRATKDARSDVARNNLSGAQAARVARLHELRTAAAKIVSVGAYYNVRARSTRATYWGVTCGLLGIVAIIAAVAWPMK
jgi:hypothetical protein